MTGWRHLLFPCIKAKGVKVSIKEGYADEGYGRIVIHCIKRISELACEEQGGFRKGRGHCTREVVEKNIGKNNKVYVAFIDLEKAYYNVNRKALWEILNIYSIWCACKWGDTSVLLNHGETKWQLPQLLYADEAVLLAESDEALSKMVGYFNDVCRRGMLKVNLSKR